MDKHAKNSLRLTPPRLTACRVSASPLLTANVHGLCKSVGARGSRDQNPADKSSKHQASPGASVMAEANAHMTAASSADADEAAMPNVTFSECHIASGLDVTH